MRYITIALSFGIFSSCNPRRPGEEIIRSQLKSNDKDTVMQACSYLQTINDTVFVASLLENPYDARISHHLQYKGISVYQAKVDALRRISGLNPPNKINYTPDTAIIAFYSLWAKEKGYLK